MNILMLSGNNESYSIKNYSKPHKKTYFIEFCHDSLKIAIVIDPFLFILIQFIYIFFPI